MLRSRYGLPYRLLPGSAERLPCCVLDGKDLFDVPYRRRTGHENVLTGMGNLDAVLELCR